jgi:hypothetical protein
MPSPCLDLKLFAKCAPTICATRSTRLWRVSFTLRTRMTTRLLCKPTGSLCILRLCNQFSAFCFVSHGVVQVHNPLQRLPLVRQTFILRTNLLRERTSASVAAIFFPRLGGITFYPTTRDLQFKDGRRYSHRISCPLRRHPIALLASSARVGGLVYLEWRCYVFLRGQRFAGGTLLTHKIESRGRSCSLWTQPN